MDKILITGATGFVGQWLTKTKPDNTVVYGVGRTKYEKMAWRSERWTSIIHLAPTPPTDILECAVWCGARVLYASSGIVYHPENTARVKYREDKLSGERECVESPADVVIARLFTFYGKGLDSNKAVTTFYNAGQQGIPLVITGDGNTTRTYMRGREMARWMWAILKHGERGEAYDVGSDFPITMLELARVYAQGAEIIIQGGKDPMPYYVPEDTAKTIKLLTK